MTDRARIAAIALTIFALALAGRELFRHLPVPQPTLLWKTSWLIWCGLGLWIASRLRPSRWPRELGLAAPWRRSLIVAFVASLPLFVALALTAEFAALSAGALMLTAIVTPLTEEALFRGYLIRQLHRRAGWSFLAAVTISAGVFGFMHLPRAAATGDWSGVVLQIAVTGAGGFFFGWLFVRSEDNLWLPIGVHGFLNLWWALFAVGETAVGAPAANVGRGLSILAAIWLVHRAYPSIPVRSEQPPDADAIRAVHEAAFPTPLEARIVDALRSAGRLSISLVALRGETVIGHVAFSPVQLPGTSDGLGLAPVAVLPEHQRRGVGGTLVRAGIERCREIGAGFVVLIGDPEYYSRFGFRPASGWNLRDEFGGGEAFQAIELRSGAIPATGGLVRYAFEFQAAEE